MGEAEARRLLEAGAGPRLALIADSYARLTGRPLLAAGERLWTAPRVILAHGTQADPVFFYGNRLALELFELTAEALLRTPSRLSAEPLGRDERARLLDRVARQGFIDDYAGVRVSAAGRRFRIERATVWNLLDTGGAVQGQAATFADWTPL
jgi:hypothetical protein